MPVYEDESALDPNVLPRQSNNSLDIVIVSALLARMAQHHHVTPRRPIPEVGHSTDQYVLVLGKVGQHTVALDEEAYRGEEVSQVVKGAEPEKRFYGAPNWAGGATPELWDRQAVGFHHWLERSVPYVPKRTSATSSL